MELWIWKAWVVDGGRGTEAFCLYFLQIKQIWIFLLCFVFLVTNTDKSKSGSLDIFPCFPSSGIFGLVITEVLATYSIFLTLLWCILWKVLDHVLVVHASHVNMWYTWRNVKPYEIRNGSQRTAGTQLQSHAIFFPFSNSFWGNPL